MADSSLFIQDMQTGSDSPQSGSSRTLAGLCYVNVLLINLIVPVLVIITGKGGRYAKFHALQNLMLVAVETVIMLVVTFALVGSVLLNDAKSTYSSSEAFMYRAPLFVLGLVWFALWVYLAFKAFTGNGVSLPVIGSIARRFA